jgi:hypothetical protein
VVRYDHTKGLVRINMHIKVFSIDFELEILRLVFLLLQ